MKKLVVLSIVLLSAFALRAQQIDSRLTSLVPRASAAGHRVQTVEPRKFDPEAVLRDLSVTFNPDSTIASLSALAVMKKGVACPTEKIESLGIKVNDVIGSVALLTVPADRLYALEGVGEIDYVEADQMCEPQTDIGRQMTGVDVLQGTAADVLVDNRMVPAWEAAGLPQTYTGKGIVVGVVDDGMDFNHIAFKDQNGNSRVKMVYTGDELTKYENPEDIALLTTDNTESSHGTHTTAIAAGSAVPSYTVRPLQGMAPEAELVMCGLDEALTKSRILQSIKTIFEYADQVQKPAVVSISLGTAYGMKDGKHALSVAIDEITLNGTKPGRIIVQSAGNEGDNSFTLEHQLDESDKSDDGYCFYTMLANNRDMTYGNDNGYLTYPKGFTVLLYSLDNQEFTCNIVAVDSVSGKVYYLDEKSIYYYSRASESFSEFPSFFQYPEKGVFNGKYFIEYFYRDSYSFQGEDDKNIRLVFYVKGHKGQKIRMICKDNTFFATPAVPGKFMAGNSNTSINIEACTDAVISVGNYVERPNWQSLYQRENNYDPQDNHYYTNPLLRVVGGIAPDSSYGIDDNGIARPDILAPGAPILSAYNRYDERYFEANELFNPKNARITDKLTVNGSNYYYGMMGGTSMSTPCMAGIIALWLQQDPTLSTADVRRLLSLTADNDEFTTDVSKIPSGNLVQAAKGKVNAVNGMKMLVEKTTGIHSLAEDTENAASFDEWHDAWYTLQGVRLAGKPAARGIYLKGGRKVWVK